MNTLLEQRLFFGFFRLSGALGVGVLVLVLALLFLAGGDALSLDFLTSPWVHSDITKGGIFPAVVGSVWLGVGVTVFSFPLGIGTAVYLTEYGKDTFLRRLVQLAIRNLAGVPSVVYGLFGLAAFVHMLNFGMTLLSAMLTLSVMTLPWIISGSVEALEAVPQKMRDSSMALGATQWQTISKVVLPAALPGCITGGILGISRALGETAPIILVGATFYLANLPSSPMDKYMALPYHAFILATQHSSPFARQYASGTALVLILLTFVLSLGAILLRYRFRSQKVW